MVHRPVLIDINSATPDQIKTMVGIGDTYARRIVERRPYQCTNELVAKKVIPQLTYDRIKDYMTTGLTECK
jgi:DNA uptake protein ComE-like DNA-binding protein